MPLSQETMCCDFETQKTWNEMEKTPSYGNSESQSVSAQPKKKGKGSRGPVTMKLPEFDSHEEKAAFMINEFKVKLCTRRRRHAWSGCPYAHRGETARRRDPCTYHAVPCPEMRQGNRCPRGEACHYSHHDFEYWLHPARYCTVMCNKGTKCDRALCFFAHSPEELRVVPTNGDISLNNDPSTPPDQLSDSSSNGRNNFEKTGLNGDDMISCGSYASMPEASAPLQRKNEHWTPRTNPSIPPTLGNEQSRVILSNKAPRTALTRPAISSSIKKENVEPVFECPYSITECTASSNISQLLPQRHSSPCVMGFPQLPPNADEELLRTRLSSKSASHFSPTCHFSGSSKEFTNEVTPAVVSSSSKGLTTGLEGFGGTNQDCLDWMHRDQCMFAAQNCSAMDIKQVDLMQPAQMNPATQALDQNGGCTYQAMDYLRNLEQCPASQSAALFPFASSPSLFGDQSRQDLLSNVETLQLLKLQLLCNMQGGELQSPASLFSPPSLLNPQFSCEEPRSRDALYSLQEATSVFNMLPYLNLIRTTGVNTDNHF